MDPLFIKDLQISTVFVFMLVGLVGLVVPVFPGLIVIWLAALGYGLLSGFGLVGWIVFILISLLMVSGSFVDNILMGSKALQEGANWWALALGGIGGILGSIFLPPLGGIPGALLAVFLYEFFRRKDWKKAFHLTKSVAVGCGWAFIIRFGMGFMMIVLWLVWAFQGKFS